MSKSRIILLLILTFIGTADALDPPRLRPSPYFGNFLGMEYAGIDDLGCHDYAGLAKENNALIYTAAAGYIDLGHLRESADRTKYIFEICRYNILIGNARISFRVIEPAIYNVFLEYPSTWNDLKSQEKEKLARNISINLASHLAHRSTIWHEIITWFGYSSVGLLSEKPSSFSWEDSYSDLLGTKIAALALADPNSDYNTAMTQLIKQEIQKLSPEPANTAYKATALIDTKWFSGRYPFISMNKRNFDVGLDDNMVTPFRVPGICDETPEIPCEVPGLPALARCGFAIHLELVPRESERTSILKIIYKTGNGDKLMPEDHFPIIIEHIRQEAIKQSGEFVDKPTL